MSNEMSSGETPDETFNSDPMTADDLVEFETVMVYRDKLVADTDLQALTKRALADVLAGVQFAARGALAAGEASLPVLEPLVEAAVRGLVSSQLEQMKGRFGRGSSS